MTANERTSSRALKLTYGDICWDDPPKELPPSPSEMLKKFIEQILSSGVFSFIIVPEYTGLLSRFVAQKNLSRICFDEDYIIQNKDSFTQLAIKSGMMVAINNDGDEKLIKLYKDCGWLVSVVAFQEAIDDSSRYLEVDVMKLISKFNGNFFFFNHDADPIYFLST